MVLLIGNPNVGKTTFFNQITGSSAHTGNFSGVTVTKTSAYLKGTKTIITDLPGTYYFLSHQNDERVVIDTLLHDQYESIIQILDGTHLKRGLQLTLQLLELDVPLILVVNMKDEVEMSGFSFRKNRLEQLLGIPVLYLQASKMNTKDFDNLKECLKKPQMRRYQMRYSKKLEEKINRLVTSNHNRFSVITQTNDLDFQTELFYERQREANKIYSLVMQPLKGKNRIKERNEFFDQILFSPVLGSLIFLMILLLIYQISFGSGFLGLGNSLKVKFEQFFFQDFKRFMHELINFGGIIKGSFLDGLIMQGVIGGVGGVLVFLPQIMILYCLLFLLEGSGYLARLVVVMDYWMAKWGLSGETLIPLITGFGCCVPAILSTRTIQNKRERRLTLLILPFISCSARLPVYAMMVSLFFPKYQAWIIMAIYLLGVIVLLISAKLITLIYLKKVRCGFVMELPPYRTIRLKLLGKEIIKKVKTFLNKAGTTILIGSICLWILTYDPNGSPQNSILGFWASRIAFLFQPLGIGSWQNVVSLFSGFIAKETVLSSFTILYQLNGNYQALHQYFSSLDAICFLVFYSLYIPCFATISTIKQEKEKKSDLVFAIIYPLVLSYLITYLIRLIGLFITS